MSQSGSPRAPSPGSCAAQSSHNGGPVTINPEIPRAQRLALTPPLPLTHFVGLTDRNLAITQAFASGAYTQQQIAQTFDLHL